jgi:hypothetical protein
MTYYKIVRKDVKGRCYRPPFSNHLGKHGPKRIRYAPLGRWEHPVYDPKLCSRGYHAVTAEHFRRFLIGHSSMFLGSWDSIRLTPTFFKKFAVFEVELAGVSRSYAFDNKVVAENQRLMRKLNKSQVEALFAGTAS